jgi:mono/diheme cytochrome c family protein
VFDAPLAPSGALPRIERDTEDHAVRGWLHANCAGCHRPGGPTGAGLDLRYASALAELGACDVAPALGDLGVTGAKLLLPGDPARSLLSLRVQLTGAGQMPPLARALVDSAGSAALERWIRSFPSCSGPDGDGDGRVDTADNCPRTANASQTDSDGDGIGDACETACRNGLDDDGDGAADHPLDPGCASAGAASESPACDDGIDNDGDGLVDGPLDIGCAGASATRENPPCADGLDNDRDRRIDFDGGRWLGLAAPTAADPHCGGRPSADFEAPGCGLGLELVPLLGLVAALRWRRARRA